MINSLPYVEVSTDLSITIDPNNSMQLIVDYTYFSDCCREIKNDGSIVIPFSADLKYTKLISIYLLNDGTLVIDEPFDDYFFYASVIDNVVDKICWFSIPIGYNSPDGLNGLNIYAKVGV